MAKKRTSAGAAVAGLVAGAALGLTVPRADPPPPPPVVVETVMERAVLHPDGAKVRKVGEVGPVVVVPVVKLVRRVVGDVETIERVKVEDVAKTPQQIANAMEICARYKAAGRPAPRQQEWVGYAALLTAKGVTIPPAALKPPLL
jgi:hypothetical protein